MAANSGLMARNFALGLSKARASVDTTPRPRCPFHPNRPSRRLYLTHPSRVLSVKEACRMGCDLEVEALTAAGFTVEDL